MKLTFRTVLALTLALLMLGAQGHAQSSSYRIQPGDRLDITVLEDATLNRQALLVGPDGSISLPLAGTVRAGGQTIEAVQSNIAERLAPNFAIRPNVFVALAALAPEPLPGELETVGVFVLGQVGSPGLIEVEPGTTLLQAISLAGGLERFAATQRIQVRRTDPQTGQERLFLFNYRSVERGAAITSSLAVRDGDVILVPERRLFE
jgi:polysaccharide export outer membrane protein